MLDGLDPVGLREQERKAYAAGNYHLATLLQALLDLMEAKSSEKELYDRGYDAGYQVGVYDGQAGCATEGL